MSVSIAISDAITATKDAIVSLGVLELLSGNAPFLLQGDSTVWLVESGTVEIFNVQLRDGELVGARAHFMSIGEGALLFGMDLESFGGGSGFLAVGAVGTRDVLLSNAGDAPCTVDAITRQMGGSDAFTLTSGGAPPAITLMPFATALFTLQFAPTATGLQNAVFHGGRADAKAVLGKNRNGSWSPRQ